MKPILPELTLALAAVWLSGALTRAYCQDTIVYFSGPSLPFQYEPIDLGDASIDLNGDGTPDFSFQLGFFICTADVPTSACSGAYDVSALGTNAVLLDRFHRATILRFGSLIGSAPATNSTWSNPNQSATVATHFISPRYATSGLYGPLADVEKAYLRDRLGILEGRCQWVKDDTKRDWLIKRVGELWPAVKT